VQLRLLLNLGLQVWLDTVTAVGCDVTDTHTQAGEVLRAVSKAAHAAGVKHTTVQVVAAEDRCTCTHILPAILTLPTQASDVPPQVVVTLPDQDHTHSFQAAGKQVVVTPAGDDPLAAPGSTGPTGTTAHVSLAVEPQPAGAHDGCLGVHEHKCHGNH
jgi:hypothetical protein